VSSLINEIAELVPSETSDLTFSITDVEVSPIRQGK
jgi:hypothetical protein